MREQSIIYQIETENAELKRQLQQAKAEERERIIEILAEDDNNYVCTHNGCDKVDCDCRECWRRFIEGADNA